MSGPFGTTPSKWMRDGGLVYALDEHETANRFSARIEGGYEINYRRDPVRTDEAEIEANARAIAQVPAMLELVAMINSAVANSPVWESEKWRGNMWVEMARAIARRLEEK